MTIWDWNYELRHISLIVKILIPSLLLFLDLVDLVVIIFFCLGSINPGGAEERRKRRTKNNKGTIRKGKNRY